MSRSTDTRPVYVISVAAELTGMHAQTLRQYDRMGLVSPSRARGGGRRYSAADISRLQLIQRLSVRQEHAGLHAQSGQARQHVQEPDLTSSHTRRVGQESDPDGRAHSTASPRWSFTARTRFWYIRALVSGPTPPGTGVCARTGSPASASPVTPPSGGTLMPASMTTWCGWTWSARSKPALPTASPARCSAAPAKSSKTATKSAPADDDRPASRPSRKQAAGKGSAAAVESAIAEAVGNFFKCFLNPDLFDRGLDFAVREWSRRDGTVRQRIDQASEVLIARELNGDTSLLRSTCHLDASVEGIGQPG